MKINLPFSDAPRVSVIIVATSSFDLLRACLESLERFGPNTIPFETILVLNNARPEVEAVLSATVTGVKITGSAVNLGLAGAANRGRSLANGEFLLILHDDAEVEPGWMEALVETAVAHPEAGAVGGKVLHPDGRLQLAGGIVWRTAILSAPWVGEAPPPTAFDRLRAVDFCGSSSLLIRAALWDFVGGLDEQFYPVYYVDADLAMTMWKHGFAVLYQPNSRIRHHQYASTDPAFRRFLIRRNRRLFLEKWGAALRNHEPYVGDSPAAFERALVRAEIFAGGCRQMGNMIFEHSARPKTFNATEQESRHVVKSRSLQRAYAVYKVTYKVRTFVGKVGRSLMGTKRFEQARYKIVMLFAHLKRVMTLKIV
jgi:GT2 family glycosyltransferase